MKSLYLIALLAFTIGSHAQEQKTGTSETSSYPDPPPMKLANSKENPADAENPVYNPAGLDVQPEFPGGLSAFKEFIVSNFNDPVVEDGPKTLKTYVSFVVEKDGSITSIKILRDPGYGIGEEAMRVVKLSPNWKPGEQNGKPVRVSYTLPFTLNIPAPVPSKAKTGSRN